jgi:hypothetical protein
VPVGPDYACSTAAPPRTCIQVGLAALLHGLSMMDTQQTPGRSWRFSSFAPSCMLVYVLLNQLNIQVMPGYLKMSQGLTTECMGACSAGPEATARELRPPARQEPARRGWDSSAVREGSPKLLAKLTNRDSSPSRHHHSSSSSSVGLPPEIVPATPRKQMHFVPAFAVVKCVRYHDQCNATSSALHCQVVYSLIPSRCFDSKCFI